MCGNKILLGQRDREAGFQDKCWAGSTSGLVVELTLKGEETSFISQS